MAFDGLIGQNDVKKHLTDAIKNEHVGHAYIFCGEDGIGKKTFAREFAAMSMCTSPRENGERCGICQSCRLMDAGNNTDFITIVPPADKKTIVIDQIRDELQEQTLKAPVFSRRKVFLITQAEKMNENAQNALLKTLEEPPEYVMILLACSNILNMLETIRSRTIRVDFARNTNEEILQKYKILKNENAEEVSELLLCSYADGIMGRVEHFTDNSSINDTRKQLAEVLERLFNGQIEAKTEMAKMIDVTSKKYDFIFFLMVSFARDAMIMARFGRKAKILNTDLREALFRIGDAAGYYRLKNAIAVINECSGQLSKNAQADLAVQNMLVKLSNRN